MSPPTPTTLFHHLPTPLLILGTDAAGKDHVAHFIAQQVAQASQVVEKRAGWFSAPANRQRSSEHKGRFARLRERLFLATFPFTQWLIPWLLPALIAWDLRRFRPSHQPLLIVSYTPLRLLAFQLGHHYQRASDIRLPAALDRTLRSLVPATQIKTIVLDIDDAIRQRRIAQRTQQGTVDPFDQYMTQDSARSERIEHFLVWLAIHYLGAVKIENNDLDDATLAREIDRACTRLQQVGRT